MSYEYYVLNKSSLQLWSITEEEFARYKQPMYEADGDIVISYNTKTKELIGSQDISNFWFHVFSMGLEECVQDNENSARQFVDYISDYGDNPNALWYYCGTISGGVMDRLDNKE